jgi:hypothetical protein
MVLLACYTRGLLAADGSASRRIEGLQARFWIINLTVGDYTSRWIASYGRPECEAFRYSRKRTRARHTTRSVAPEVLHSPSFPKRNELHARRCWLIYRANRGEGLASPDLLDGR